MQSEKFYSQLLKVPKVTFIALKKATILLISFMMTSWIAINFDGLFL